MTNPHRRRMKEQPPGIVAGRFGIQAHFDPVPHVALIVFCDEIPPITVMLDSLEMVTQVIEAIYHCTRLVWGPEGEQGERPN